MRQADRSARRTRQGCHALVVVLLAVLGESTAQAQGEESSLEPRKAAREVGAVEVRFTDNSLMKLHLRDDGLEMETRFGKLRVPASEVRQIEFATRVPEDVSKRIDTALTNLGSAQYREREAATAELLGLKDRAYPALLRAAKSPDAEVARRADDALNKLRESLSEEQMDVRGEDVVHTRDMKLSGRINSNMLKVSTYQFGEQQLKLADLRSLRVLGAGGEAEAQNVQVDPGHLVAFHGHIGKTFLFRVTGAIQGSVWGTDAYTCDSALATAAVHAGVLQPGQTGVVKVTVLAAPPFFQGSARNGVTSAAYAGYPFAYRVSK